MDRREFGKAVGVGALGLPLVANDDALSAAPATVSTRPKKKATTKPAQESLSEADLLLEVLRRDYPDKRLTKSILSSIRGRLIGNRKVSQKLSEFPLANGDEPGFVFVPYRGE